jgi:putative flippase GtrA
VLRRAARYVLVGGIAAAIDLSFFFVFAKLLQFNYLGVATIGFAIATLVNYHLGIRLVFESGVRFSKGQELALVYLVSAAGLLINLAILFTAASILGFELMLSKILATGGVFGWNFLARNNFIFREPARSRF